MWKDQVVGGAYKEAHHFPRKHICLPYNVGALHVQLVKSVKSVHRANYMPWICQICQICTQSKLHGVEHMPWICQICQTSQICTQSKLHGFEYVPWICQICQISQICQICQICTQSKLHGFEHMPWRLITSALVWHKICSNFVKWRVSSCLLNAKKKTFAQCPPSGSSAAAPFPCLLLTDIIPRYI